MHTARESHANTNQPTKPSNRVRPAVQGRGRRLLDDPLRLDDVLTEVVRRQVGPVIAGDGAAHQLARAARLLAEKLYGAEDETADP